MQAVVELALEAPFEPRIIQVAWMQVKVVGVHRNRRTLELDDYFHTFALGARREIQQRVLIKAELSEDPFEAGGGGL